MDIAPLTPETWEPYEAFVAARNGVWGGCWCMAFHAEGVGRRGQTAEGNRAAKAARVLTGQTHAALLMQAGAVHGWVQHGPTAELPRIKNRREYEATADHRPPPDWRVTCFFIDQGMRGRGLALLALNGALDLIRDAGGGIVEGYPDETGQKTNPGFLYHGTVSVFQAAGFARDRQIGKTRWVMRRSV